VQRIGEGNFLIERNHAFAVRQPGGVDVEAAPDGVAGGVDDLRERTLRPLPAAKFGV